MILAEDYDHPDYVPGDWIDTNCKVEQYYLCERSGDLGHAKINNGTHPPLTKGNSPSPLNFITWLWKIFCQVSNPRVELTMTEAFFA
ncbi:unnamed protein product [Clavelina lepadiformis]|uniref:Uncharacterized protein n=1 Tax=Clavelina lepadiformis TaxID=159417 RepID=A0ABP0FRX9_CLALP